MSCGSVSSSCGAGNLLFLQTLLKQTKRRTGSRTLLLERCWSACSFRLGGMGYYIVSSISGLCPLACARAMEGCQDMLYICTIAYVSKAPMRTHGSRRRNLPSVHLDEVDRVDTRGANIALLPHPQVITCTVEHQLLYYKVAVGPDPRFEFFRFGCGGPVLCKGGYIPLAW